MARPASPNKQAENLGKDKSSTVLDRIEQLARIFATIAIPFIVAVGGWIIQASLDEKRTSLEYVKIAKEILTNEHAPTELTRWSWLLLNDQSPRKIEPAVLRNLIELGQRITTVSEFGPDQTTESIMSWLSPNGAVDTSKRDIIRSFLTKASPGLPITTFLNGNEHAALRLQFAREQKLVK